MPSLGYIEIFVSFVCLFILYLYKSTPMYPRTWPVVGMLPSIFGHMHRIHDRCVDFAEVLCTNTYALKGPFFDVLGTIDPANVHFITSSNFVNFPKGPEFKKIFEILGDGILNSDGDLWKNQRKQAQRLINHERFRKFLSKTNREKLENGLIPILDHMADSCSVFDLQDVFQRLALDTSCMSVTGYDPGCLSVEFPDIPFSKAMGDAEEAMLMRHIKPERLWKLQRWLGIGIEKKMTHAQTVVDDVIGKYVTMKREELSRSVNCDADDENGSDLLTSYMKGDESMGFNCDDKFLRDTVLNFIMAGHDTISSALTWFMWLVSTNPDVENKIREELNSVMTGEEIGKWRLFQMEELKNLVYLQGAICESLRLYPPVAFQHKAPVNAVTLPSGHYVHDRMRVFISVCGMGRMDNVWGKGAKEFKPERWITDHGTIKNEPSYKFFTFGAGPRTCLGKEVSFTQLKSVAATVIHNYQVEVMKDHPVVPNVSVILNMKHGLKVKVNKRWA